MFTRILVPLDGSPASNVALPLARTVARMVGGSIVLLCVLERPWSELPGNEDELEVQGRVADAREHLGRIAGELSSTGLAVESIVTRGQVGDRILEHIGLERADLVVMRTHGRVGVDRAALGSVAERVLTHTPVPVLLLRTGGQRVSSIQKILVPVDGSPGGAVALATAVGVARAGGARLDLFEAVVPVYPPDWPRYDGRSDYDPARDDEAMTRARTYVDGLVYRLRAAGVNANGEARIVDNVPAGIVEAAGVLETDLIVMSTHGLTGLPRAVLGSVADAVVRTASCPVLLVRQSESHSVLLEDLPEAATA
jgi:nucleotide-binding universal stress UspA family protein